MTRGPTNNQDDSAIDAAAERLLGELRARKVAAAERALAAAKDRLAAAQVGEQQAARDLALYDWDGNRKAVLSARDELTFAQALVEDAGRELERAKVRHTPELRKAAEAYVRREREANAFRAGIDPILAQVTQRCGEMLVLVRELMDATSRQHGVRLALRNAAEALGIPFTAHSFHVPDHRLLISDAVLQACKAEAFYPHDFRELINPVSASAPPIMAIPGAQAVPESMQEFRARREQVEARMAAQERATLAGGER